VAQSLFDVNPINLAFNTPRVAENRVDANLFPFGNAETLAQCLVTAAQRAASANLSAPLSTPMSERLQYRFSDAAGREAFWRLPMLSGLIGAAPC
jgi:hypothetical protein